MLSNYALHETWRCSGRAAGMARFVSLMDSSAISFFEDRLGQDFLRDLVDYLDKYLVTRTVEDSCSQYWYLHGDPAFFGSRHWLSSGLGACWRPESHAVRRRRVLSISPGARALKFWLRNPPTISDTTLCEILKHPLPPIHATTSWVTKPANKMRTK